MMTRGGGQKISQFWWHNLRKPINEYGPYGWHFSLPITNNRDQAKIDHIRGFIIYPRTIVALASVQSAPSGRSIWARCILLFCWKLILCSAGRWCPMMTRQQLPSLHQCAYKLNCTLHASLLVVCRGLNKKQQNIATHRMTWHTLMKPISLESGNATKITWDKRSTIYTGWVDIGNTGCEWKFIIIYATEQDVNNKDWRNYLC